MLRINLVVYILYILCGFLCGSCLEKSKLLDPGTLRLQFVMKRLLLLKMMFSATATAMLIFSLLAMFPRTRSVFMQACNYFFGVLNSRGILSSVLGGFFLGIGSVLSGSSPSTLFSQVGVQVPNSLYMLAGACVGVCLYLIMRPMFESLSKPSITDSTNPWDGSPFFILALPLVAMFGLLVVAFETLIPWRNEINVKVTNTGSWMTDKVWPPYLSGVLIGALQLPLVMLFSHTLDGGLHVFAALGSLVVRPLQRQRWEVGNASSWWQILFIAGIMAGSYYSASQSNSLGRGQVVNVSEAMIGSCLMYFGAMIAGGCTTVHGFTGLALLSILSFLTLIVTFVTGIISGHLLQYVNILRL